MNIGFEVFDTDTPYISGQKPIVLVSLDATVRPKWLQAVTSLCPDVYLNRYVIDEAHLLLTEGGYRDIMGRVQELRLHRVQLVLLSATISPTSIAQLRSQANLAPGEDTEVIRASSNRPELHFLRPTLYKELDKQTTRTIANRVNGVLKNYKDPSLRALVFVQRIDDGKVIAEVLDCDFYRGASDDTITNTDRDAMVSQWLDGTHRVMVATDAFGPGNDYAHVRHVIFVGSPKGVVDLIQMAGRAGRDGQRSLIMPLLLESRRVPNTPSSDRHSGREVLHTLFTQYFKHVNNRPHDLATIRCWRAVFSTFLDGVGQSCSSNTYDWYCPGCVLINGSEHKEPTSWFDKEGNRLVRPLNVLKPTLIVVEVLAVSPVLVGRSRRRAPSGLDLYSTVPGPTTSIHAASSSVNPSSGAGFDLPIQVSRKARRAITAVEETHIQRIQAAIQLFQGHCATCQVLEPTQVLVFHSVLHCPTMVKLLKETNNVPFRIIDEYNNKDYIDWRKQIRYVSGSRVCYQCHLPFFNDKVHGAKTSSRSGSKNSECRAEHNDMVAPLAWAVFMSLNTREELMVAFGKRWEHDQEYRMIQQNST
ncbi:P-loop containing nucleoside triphosphate hydrolase protein [Ganoderma leucocontextum]|nr:P-loop containing nucleoside triphosphate hydrolase protein [Ganoderma leucocontextum]